MIAPASAKSTRAGGNGNGNGKGADKGGTETPVDPPAPSEPTETEEGSIDEEVACLEPVPDAVSPSTTPLAIDVWVLLDGTTTETAQSVMATAAEAYDDLGIALSAAGYQPITTTSRDADQLIADAKAAVGGQPPMGFEVVYVMTARDISATDSLGESTAVAGLADCVGGARFPHHAFAVGEDRDHIDSGVANVGAKIAAHEIGHLFGGHHHLANCIEAVATAPKESCTLMFNLVDFQALRFSTVNGAIVRGHAEHAAADG